MEGLTGKLITRTTPVISAAARSTAVATTAAAATVSAASAATATAAFFAGTRFAHANLAAIQGLAGETGDGCLRGFVGGHGYKRKTAGASAHAVSDQIDFANGPKLLEEVLQVIFRRLEGQIAHE